MMTSERDPLELRVLAGLRAPGAQTTYAMPDGCAISLAEAQWGELSSTWHLPHGAKDVFEDGWDGNPGGHSSGRRGLETGRSMLVFAVRARVDRPEAVALLEGEIGGDWTVALHYNTCVIREQRLNFLVRNEMLLGTPLLIREKLIFGMFVVPKRGIANLDCSVTFSLVGFQLGLPTLRTEQSNRYHTLYAATHGA